MIDRSRPAVRVALVVIWLAFTAMISSRMAERGWIFALLAVLTYGPIMVSGALFPVTIRRWSRRHPVLDASILVPLLFFGFLLIPALPWWVAALLAFAGGAILVPIAVRRRTGNRV